MYNIPNIKYTFIRIDPFLYATFRIRTYTHIHNLVSARSPNYLYPFLLRLFLCSDFFFVLLNTKNKEEDERENKIGREFISFNEALLTLNAAVYRQKSKMSKKANKRSGSGW